MSRVPPMTVRLVDADDWKGLYVNGTLRYEGHSIPNHIWIDLLKGDIIWLDEHEGACEKLLDNGRLPDTFEKVKDEYGI